MLSRPSVPHGSIRLPIVIAAAACVLLVLIGVIAAAAAFEYWWRGTPPYSVAQIGKAIETHDLGLFRKHVDLRSVANRLIDDTMSERKQESGSTVLGQTMVEILRPRVVEAFEAQIERFVETGQFKSEKETKDLVTKDLNDMRNRIGPIAYTQIDGKVALVGLTVTPVDGKKPIVVNLKMRQTSDGYWQVMEVQVPK